MVKIYDIVYSNSRGDLPSEIYIDGNKFNCIDNSSDIYSKGYNAIKQITGIDAASFKIELDSDD